MHARAAPSFLLRLLLPALSAAAAVPAAAMTFHVTRFDDPAPVACTQSCSLREAVLAANGSPGADNLLLPAGDYSVNSAIEVLDELDIAGAARATTRIASGTYHRVFDLARGQSLQLRKLTLHGGGGVRSGAFGDGVTADTQLQLLDFAADPDGGTLSAVEAHGQLTATGVHFENSPFEGVFSVDFQGDRVQISDAVLLHNAEGLRLNLDSAAARASVTRTRIDGGGAENSCAALNILGQGQVRIENLEQRDYFSFGDAAVCLYGYAAGLQAEIHNSTIAENNRTELRIGGLASANIVNTTLGSGGLALRDNASASLLHATIKGGFSHDGASLHYANSVIDGSCGGYGPRTRAGRNTITSTSCGIQQSINPVVPDSLLGGLSYNGGNTRTMLPQPGSPLIGAAAGTLCTTYDQRGFLRVPPCDIGAVESDGVDAIFGNGFESTN